MNQYFKSNTLFSATLLDFIVRAFRYRAILPLMFIRQTQTRSSSTGASYFTYRLVESRWLGNKVSQHTLLNPGTNFDLPAEAWSELCTRVEQILRSEEPLFAVDAAIEHTAQHIYSQIIARRGELSSLEIGQTEEFEEVDVNSLQLPPAPSAPNTSPWKPSLKKRYSAACRTFSASHPPSPSTT